MTMTREPESRHIGEAAPVRGEQPGVSESAPPVLRTYGLTKRFGKRIAVDNLNLTVREGEVFGLLGPNGSGKSTTVAMILGLVRPTAGRVELFGQSANQHRWSAMRRIGAIIESPSFYPYLSGRDNLRIEARALGGISAGRIEAVLRRVGLLDRAGDRYEDYSLGMKQRLGIASTLLRDPGLIILDEPTNGLDPAGTREVRSLIPQLAREGRAVLLCSHLLHEVEQVCHRVAIIKQGRELAEGTVSDLLAPRGTLRVRVGDGALDRAQELALRLPWASDVSAEDGLLLVRGSPERAADLNRALVSGGVDVLELMPVHPTLENVFLELTGEDAGGRDGAV